jgi:hypothetical protein
MELIGGSLGFGGGFLGGGNGRFIAFTGGLFKCTRSIRHKCRANVTRATIGPNAALLQACMLMDLVFLSSFKEQRGG